MTLIGYLPSIEAQFTFHDSNSPAATTWGYQFIGYIQKTGGSSQQRFPQGRIEASTLTDGSSQIVRFPGVTPGQSYDAFVSLADGQGNETAQVTLFTNYSVPKVASGSPVGPIWGRPHFLPTSTDPTNGVWDTTTNALDQGAHDPTVLVGSVTGIAGNMVPDSDFRFRNTYWNFNGSNVGWDNSFTPNGVGVEYTGNGSASGFNGAQSSISITLKANVEYCISSYIDASPCSTSGAININLRDSSGYGTILAQAAQGAGARGRVSFTYTPTVTQEVWLQFDTGNGVVANGSSVLWYKPQIEVGSAPTAYKPSALDDQTGYWARGAHHPDFKNTINSGGGVNFSQSGSTGNLGYSNTSTEYQGNFDSSGIAKKTTMMNTHGLNLNNVEGVPQYSYTSTTTSITITIPTATFTRADGSTVSTNGGSNFSQTWSGLAASTTYYWNLYYDAPSNSYGAPSYGTTAPTSAQKFSDCYADGRIAIYAGLSLATPASGSGGGSGGGGGSGVGGNCPAEWQEITTKRGIVRADCLEIGDEIRNGSEWVRVTELTRLPAPIWHYELADEEGNTEGFDVNDTHALCKDGEWVKVRDLKIGDCVDGIDGGLRVMHCHFVTEAHYIAMEVAGHVYTLGKAVVHNPITL